jgi:hypothetical protein
VTLPSARTTMATRRDAIRRAAAPWFAIADAADRSEGRIGREVRSDVCEALLDENYRLAHAFL